MHTPAPAHLAETSKAPPLHGIQSLRSIAVFLVVVTHVNLIMGHANQFGVSPMPMRVTGMYGVALFFVISGFIMVTTSLTADRAPRTQLSTFMAKRFVRIVPYMWLCIIGYNALSYLGTGTVEWAAMVRALTLWPIGELKPNVIWSLQYELIFYVLFAVAFLARRQMPLLLAAWCLAPLATRLWFDLSGNLTFSDPSLREFARVFFLGGFSGANMQFGAGVIIGLLFLRYRPFFRHAMPGGAAALALASLVLAAMVEWLAYPIGGYGRMLVWTALAAATVALGALNYKADTRLQRGLNLVGDASYSIYLVHSAVLLVAFAVVKKAPMTVPPMAILVVVSLVSMAAGMLAYQYVERPLLRWMRRPAKS